MKKKVNLTPQLHNMPCQYFYIGPPYGRVREWKDLDAVSYLVSAVRAVHANHCGD